MTGPCHLRISWWVALFRNFNNSFNSFNSHGSSLPSFCLLLCRGVHDKNMPLPSVIEHLQYHGIDRLRVVWVHILDMGVANFDDCDGVPVEYALDTYAHPGI